MRTLQGHKGPIFSLRWSRKGTYLLSGSADKTAAVWDAQTGKLRQQWDLHEGDPGAKCLLAGLATWGAAWAEAPAAGSGWLRRLTTTSMQTTPDREQVVHGKSCSTAGSSGKVLLSGVKTVHCPSAGATLDVDWRDSRSFATSSQDATVCLCRLGEAAPTQRFTGHQGEVNAVKWEPSGALPSAGGCVARLELQAGWLMTVTAAPGQHVVTMLPVAGPDACPCLTPWSRAACVLREAL